LRGTRFFWLHWGRDRLINEHDGNIVADDVKKLAVFAEEGGFDFFGDRFAGAVLELAGGDSLVERADSGVVREAQQLMRLGTAKDFEEVGSDHGVFSAAMAA
jgi:hypothetical protein